MSKPSLLTCTRFIPKVLAVPIASVVFLSTCVYAQTNTNTAQLPSVLITGSLIPTAETVGPAPVNTVTTTDLEHAGQQDVLSSLIKLDPAFSGSGNIGQVANNFSINGALPAGEANVAIRNLPTLVLLNGHRLPNSALSGGQLVDLNNIPLSIIDRVEILKDGASALYGSDAIGGVVNVITKKNWNGTEIAGRVGFPTKDDSNGILERRASIISGATGENYSFFIGGQYYYMDPLLSKDRKIASLDIPDLIAKGVSPVVAYFSPSYAGRVQDDTGSYILAGSPFANGTSTGQYQAVPGLMTPPIVPGFNVGASATPIQDYNEAAFALYGFRPYIPLGLTPLGSQLDGLDPDGNLGLNGQYPLLNTTSFGTHTIQTQDRRNVYANFEYDLFEKHLQVFGDFLFANNLSRGELAPSPMISLTLYNIAVPADNPFNPFGIALGGNGGAGTPRIRSRFVDTGNRVFDAQSDTYHIVAGLKGEITPKYNWEASYNYNRADQTFFTRNAVNGAGLNEALAGLLTDANGNPLPSYNIFGLDGFNATNAATTVDTTRATLFQTGVSELWGADALFHGTPFELPAGPFDFVVGGTYVFESVSLAVDGLTQLGLVPGLNQQFPFDGGKRDRAAVFTEVRIPILSEAQCVPGFYNLEVTAAGRYERLWPGGDSAVPKVGVRWQPIDQHMTLRGGYSQGFLAPSIYNLFGPDFISNPILSLPGGAGQVQTQNRSNPNLEPADSENWNVGIVISPKQIPGLTISVDYYNVHQSHVVISDPVGAANSLNALGSASPFAPGFTFFDNSVLTTTDPNQVTANNWGNLLLTNTASAALRTDGIDMSANYEIPTERYGTFSFLANANLTLNFEVRSDPSLPYFHYEGQYTANFGTSQGLIPDYRLNMGFTWDFCNFSYNIMAHYIPSVTDLGFLHPQVGADFQGFTLNNEPREIPDYYTIDMQISYRFPPESGKWLQGLRLAVGCNNILDADVPLIPSAIEDNTDKGTYDILGRFIYFEVSKKF